MTEQHFHVGKAPLIHIADCKGDLVVRPWMDMDVRAKGQFTVEEEDDRLSFTSTGSLSLYVPQAASIQVEVGHGDVVIRNLTGDVGLQKGLGDAVIGNVGATKVGQIYSDLVAKNLTGNLSIEEVAGDLVVRNLDGDLAIGLANGDVSVKNIAGSAAIKEANGDISVRNVSGDLEIEQGNRDANIRNLAGQCKVNRVEGDIRLVGGLGPYDHTLNAAGDVVIKWPVTDALLLEAEASSIKNRLPLLDVEETKTTLTGRLGEGKTRLTVTAGGRLILKDDQVISKKWDPAGDMGMDLEFDFLAELSNLGEKISAEVNEQVARVTSDLENNFGPDFAQRMADKFSQTAAKASAKAQAAAEREYARSTSYKYKPKKRTRRSTEPSAASTSEAQLKILKMVEDGVITPDEASILLDAL